MKYAQLNSDVFTGTVTVDWSQMREEYAQYKKVKGDTQSTLYETALTLRHFERLIGRCSSKQITQNAIDKFILDRGKEIERSTLNKEHEDQKEYGIQTTSGSDHGRAKEACLYFGAESREDIQSSFQSISVDPGARKDWLG